MLMTAEMNKLQLQDPNSPLYPATRVQFNYQGKDYYVMSVPTDEGIKEWALVKASRASTQFVDPKNPGAGLITWEGNWRSLNYVYKPNFSLENYFSLWDVVNMPQAIKNSLIIAVISEIGVLMASIAVAYGFSRFRIPGGKWLFFLLIATILIPDSITIVPTYFTFVRILNWNGTFAPLIVPHLFGNAIYIFLLRQNFKSIPRDLDEAAMLDGAGPLRILTMVILPQSIPVVATVALLHFFYSWNELRNASLYLGIAPQLHTVSFSIQGFQSIAFTPELLQASALLAMAVPVLVLFIFQRFFMQDMVVTGLEK
jgi:multiple sugar transport system permease protein